MTPTIEATKAEHVPADASVRHYDELTGAAKHALPVAVDRGTVEVRWQTAEQFATVDVIKFTSYYRVTIAEFQDTRDRADRGDRDAAGLAPRSGDRHLD